MRNSLRLATAVAVLAGVLACSQAAHAGRTGAGHNPATTKLENAFKIALYFRSISKDGCYPPAQQLARKITKDPRGRKVGVARGAGSLPRNDLVFVLRRGTTCNKVMMALRDSSGLYILNSALGTIRVQGRRGPRVEPGKPGPPRGIRILSKTFKTAGPDHADRFTTLCPGNTYPIGGGMLVNQPPGSDGEGVYPHSFERLGAQRGFHVTTVLYDLSWDSTTPRNVTVQAVCARGQIPQNPTPHKTVFILPGQTKSAIARCPKGQQLITGGFQRTNFASDGGNYVTESRAVGTRAWKVTGSAFIGTGTTGGGELTSIAYCVRKKRPILTEVVSAPTAVAQGTTADATTPPCPRNLRLTSTGFALDSRNGFYTGNSLNDDGTTTASAFGYFGPANLTSYGYCQRAKG
ncbi:MAG TPA: hypothetical protein VKA41_09725 [Solirubrobacterales bacterium]|nr:hypothetical protein [Solirubrobacterales bacterium]